MGRRSIAYRFVGDFIVLVHSDEAVDDAEWADYIGRLAERFDGGRRMGLRTLVVTPSGKGPDARQRTMLHDLAQGKSLPAAVMTDSLTGRAMVTALSWFNPGIAAFKSDDLEGAMQHLDTPALPPIDEVRVIIRELRAELN